MPHSELERIGNHDGPRENLKPDTLYLRTLCICASTTPEVERSTGFLTSLLRIGHQISFEYRLTFSSILSHWIDWMVRYDRWTELSSLPSFSCVSLVPISLPMRSSITYSLGMLHGFRMLLDRYLDNWSIITSGFLFLPNSDTTKAVGVLHPPQTMEIDWPTHTEYTATEDTLWFLSFFRVISNSTRVLYNQLTSPNNNNSDSDRNSNHNTNIADIWVSLCNNYVYCRYLTFVTPAQTFTEPDSQETAADARAPFAPLSPYFLRLGSGTCDDPCCFSFPPSFFWIWKFLLDGYTASCGGINVLHHHLHIGVIYVCVCMYALFYHSVCYFHSRPILKPQARERA